MLIAGNETLGSPSIREQVLRLWTVTLSPTQNFSREVIFVIGRSVKLPSMKGIDEEIYPPPS